MSYPKSFSKGLQKSEWKARGQGTTHHAHNRCHPAASASQMNRPEAGTVTVLANSQLELRSELDSNMSTSCCRFL